jgi:hypothetical protein
MGENKKNSAWAEAKKRCRLNQNDIQMAKELGMTPKSLLKTSLHLLNNGKHQLRIGFVTCMKKSLGSYERQNIQSHHYVIQQKKRDIKKVHP